MSEQISRHEAEKLIGLFTPMFSWLEEHGVRYCLVGGLAVMIHSYVRKADTFRMTNDGDIMFDNSFDNAAFGRAYLELYAADPLLGPEVYDAVFGDGAFAELELPAQSLTNISFVGATEELDGCDTPDFDIVRMLNSKTLDELAIQTLNVLGTPVHIATIEQLLAMKENTIRLLKADIADTSRPQDFIDIQTLVQLKGIEN